MEYHIHRIRNGQVISMVGTASGSSRVAALLDMAERNTPLFDPYHPYAMSVVEGDTYLVVPVDTRISPAIYKASPPPLSGWTAEKV